ncbi:MAG: hypothetical protein LUQ09_00995 [Methanomassiliicoccales archaeon]|nr:hypothetical protein [Methanomassiliicoccales archaeon]
MVLVQVSEHRLVNIRRRSLCDNCSLSGCITTGRITTCDKFRPLFAVFLRCKGCGAIYDPYESICSLDYELCPECNDVKEECSITIVCRP